MFTIDPGAHVDNDADTMSRGLLAEHVGKLDLATLETTPADLKAALRRQDASSLGGGEPIKFDRGRLCCGRSSSTAMPSPTRSRCTATCAAVCRQAVRAGSQRRRDRQPHHARRALLLRQRVEAAGRASGCRWPRDSSAGSRRAWITSATWTPSAELRPARGRHADPGPVQDVHPLRQGQVQHLPDRRRAGRAVLVHLKTAGTS